MRFSKQMFVFGSVFFLQFFASKFSYGWTLNFDPPARVVGTTLSFAINYANCPNNLDTVVDRAIENWNSAPTSFLRLDRSGVSTVVGGDIASGSFTGFVIVCDQNYAVDTGSDPNQTIAISIPRSDSNSVIYSAGVILNVQSDVFLKYSPDNQVQVLTHEIGHALGLGHSSEANAIMYYQARIEGAKASLGLDDVQGITYLYSRNDFMGKSKGLFGCGTLSPGGGNPKEFPRDKVMGMLELLSFFSLIWIACFSLKRDLI